LVLLDVLLWRGGNDDVVALSDDEFGNGGNDVLDSVGDVFINIGVYAAVLVLVLVVRDDGI
jgi:hypothetical protein